MTVSTADILADDILSIADWANANDQETPALILLTLAWILKQDDQEALSRWQALAEEWRRLLPPAGGTP